MLKGTLKKGGKKYFSADNSNYDFYVSYFNSAWELLTGEGKGQRHSSFPGTLVARRSQKVLLLKYSLCFLYPDSFSWEDMTGCDNGLQWSPTCAILPSMREQCWDCATVMQMPFLSKYLDSRSLLCGRAFWVISTLQWILHHARKQTSLAEQESSWSRKWTELVPGLENVFGKVTERSQLGAKAEAENCRWFSCMFDNVKPKNGSFHTLLSV